MAVAVAVAVGFNSTLTSTTAEGVTEMRSGAGATTSMSTWVEASPPLLLAVMLRGVDGGDGDGVAMRMVRRVTGNTGNGSYRYFFIGVRATPLPPMTPVRRSRERPGST